MQLEVHFITGHSFDLIQKMPVRREEAKLNKLGRSRTRKSLRWNVQFRQLQKSCTALWVSSGKDGFVYGETLYAEGLRKCFRLKKRDIACNWSSQNDMQARRSWPTCLRDVGYGKTEVPFVSLSKRFRKANSGVFVQLRSCSQHYNTFVQRMKDFPVRVDLLCRFRTQRSRRKQSRLKKRIVRFVIGTHVSCTGCKI